VLFQPMAADDVAAALAKVAAASPVNGMVEIGGPEKFRLNEIVQRRLTALHDPREVIRDAQAGYYGIQVSERSLIPGDDAKLGETRFESWLNRPANQAPKSDLQPA
jgi:uncharacterized protein YbjT (DUF2867 family)